MGDFQGQVILERIMAAGGEGLFIKVVLGQPRFQGTVQAVVNPVAIR